MIIFSLCLLLFINAMSIGLVFPIFAPLFTTSTSPFFTSDTLITTKSLFYTMILAVPTIFMIFGAPFWGRISDYIGRRQVLLISLIGIAISFALSVLGITIGGLFLLFFSRAIAGFMDGSEAVAQAAIADLSAQHEKARNMSLATWAGTLGFIVGPIIGGFLADKSITGRFHYQIPFVLSALLTLVNAYILYRYFPVETKFVATNQQKAKIGYIKLLTKGFIICFDLRIRKFAWLIFVLQFGLAAFFQLSTLVLVEQFHYTSAQVGMFTTFLGACFSLGIFLVIHVILKHLNHKTMLILGIVLCTVSLIAAVIFANSALLAWVSVVPLMLGIAMMYNVLLVFVSNAVSDVEQGDALGSVTSLKAFGWLLSGLLVGIIYPHTISILLVLLLIFILAFLSSLTVKESK